LIKKHLQECKKAQQITNFNDKKKDSNSNYDNEVTLKEKGYYGDEIKN
jgi:hypothetical protein